MSEVMEINKEEYFMLKKKAEIADDAIVQLKLGLNDLRKGKIKKF